MKPEDFEQFKSSISFFYYDYITREIMQNEDHNAYDFLTQKAIASLDTLLSKYDLHNTQIHQFFKEIISTKLKDLSNCYEGKLYCEEEMRKLWKETNELAEKTSLFISSHQNTLISSTL
ncbi:MAG: hypothetical protein WC413_00685 [Candidatus Nanoarchaeia archaeon]